MFIHTFSRTPSEMFRKIEAWSARNHCGGSPPVILSITVIKLGVLVFFLTTSPAPSVHDTVTLSL